jgi:hypothetical protein
MNPTRVYELAKALNISTKNCLLRFQHGGYKIKTHMNFVSEPEITFMLTQFPDITIEDLENRLEKSKPPSSKHPVTSPWNADDNPWALNRLKLKIPRRPGWRPKFAAPHKVELHKHEGYKIADKRDYGYDLHEGDSDTPEGTVLKRREMILMEIPEELALQRDAFMEHKTRQRSKTSVDIAHEGDERRLGYRAEKTPEHRLAAEDNRFVPSPKTPYFNEEK